jgi:hypothetical protein
VTKRSTTGRHGSGRAARALRSGDRAALCVVLLAIGANLPSLGVGFPLDDHGMIERNPAVQELRLADLWTRTYYPGAERTSEYRPVGTTSFALEHALLGGGAWHFHAVNIGLHALVAWLVLAAGRALRLREAEAVVAAALFAVHPVHVDAIAPVVGRLELLAAIGFVGPLLVWARLRGDGVASPGRLALLAGLLAVGLLSKENAYAVVPLLAALEIAVFRARAPRRPLLLASATALAVVAATLALRVAALGAFASGEAPPVYRFQNPLFGEPAAARALTAATLVGTYLRLFALPVRLSPDYSFDSLPVVRAFTEAPLGIAGPLVLLAGLAVLSLAWLRRLPQLAVAAVAFAAPLAIVSNAAFPIGTMLAERLLYLPTLGLVWIAALAGIGGLRRIAPALLERPRAALAAAALPVCALAAASIERSDDWRDEGGLYREALVHYPRNFLLWRNLGSLALEEGRCAEAVERMTRVNEIAPGYARAWGDRGYCLGVLGDYSGARAALERSADLDPRDPAVWRNLAAAYERLDLAIQAQRALDRAEAANAQLLQRQR